MICTVIFCLVFTAPAKWRIELRAKIGQYRNRCFELPQNLHQRLSKAVKTCWSWCHNSRSTMLRVNSGKERNNHSYRGPGLASECWATCNFEARSIHTTTTLVFLFVFVSGSFIWERLWSVLLIYSPDKTRWLINAPVQSVKCCFHTAPLFSAWRHNALFGTDPGNSLRKP